MAWAARTYRLEQVFPIARERLWALLSDTDHLNRVIGLFSVSAGPPVQSEGELYRWLSARVFGMIPLEWKEYPFDWTRNERYTTVREFAAGPLTRMVGRLELADAAPLSDGSPATRLTLVSEFYPRNLLGVLAARVEGYTRMVRTMEFAAESVRLEQAGRPEALPELGSSFQVDSARLDRLLDELGQRPVQPDLLGRLRSHLTTQGGDEVAGMGPFRLAHRWMSDPTETLRLFLYAAKVGVLNLNWSMLCPACRVAKADAESLATLPHTAHCDLCGIDFEGTFDRFIELTFSVHPAIRQASRAVYCVSGPALSPHIQQQAYLRAGASAVYTLPEGSDEMRLRMLRFNHVAALSPDAGEESTGLILTPDGWQPGEVRRPPAGATLAVSNQSGEDAVVVLERVDWDPLVVTAARVTAMQEFRDLFSSEVLAPGHEVGIASVTLMFSDLLGSTALYEMAGDAPAYGKVRRHFDFMIGWVRDNQGTLVKTIGDAVMAVFYTPEAGVRACLEIQRHVDEFNAALPPGSEPIIIKMGLHHGPSIAINANERLDYFGRTVNIAARVQRESKGGDLVMTAETYRIPGVQAVLTEFGATAEPYTAMLRGIEEAVGVVRLRLQPRSMW